MGGVGAGVGEGVHVLQYDDVSATDLITAPRVCRGSVKNVCLQSVVRVLHKMIPFPLSGSGILRGGAANVSLFVFFLLSLPRRGSCVSSLPTSFGR